MAQFTGEGVYSSISGRRVGLGSKAPAEACSELCGIDYNIVFKACRSALGSGTETIALLLKNYGISSSDAPPMRFSEVVELAENFRALKKKADKVELLKQQMQQLPPQSIRFMIRIFSQYSLRIGFELRSVLQAIALAAEQPLQEVRKAHQLSGSLAKTTEMAFENRLQEVRFRPFHPMAFMLASPTSIEEAPTEGYIYEEKFDGMRAQLHANGQQIQLYSRDLNEITSSFPEIAQEFSKKQLPATVLDGEIVVYKQDCIQPFRFLQQRMGVKKPSKKLLEEYPVRFIAYDLLIGQQREWFDEPLIRRREALEEICIAHQIAVAKQFSYGGRDALKQAFRQALENGNEGLMLKDIESWYEYGQRKKQWLKLKEPVGNLDTVLLYAHAGSGKRGGLYSDFTLGIRVADDERYSEDYIPIGKAYGGYTDSELKDLNKRIKKLVLQRFGPTLSLKPSIVIELEFEQIMQNKRTKAGYTLRLPRFKAIRWDKKPEDCNTLKDVEELYQAHDGFRQASENSSDSFSLN